MKTLLVCAVFALVVGGCATPSAKPPATHPDPRPGGTEVGTSFPDVNQATTDTTATRSNDTSH